MFNELNCTKTGKEHIKVDYNMWPIQYELAQTKHIREDKPQILRVFFRPDIYSIPYPIIQVGSKRIEGRLVFANGHRSEGGKIIPIRFAWVDLINENQEILMTIDLFSVQRGSLPFQTKIILPGIRRNHEYILTPLNHLCQQRKFQQSVRALIAKLKQKTTLY